MQRWRRWILGALVVAVAALLTHWGYSRTAHRYYTEWNYFELGGRTIVGYHHEGLYGGGALHVYATNPQLQIGPPILWLVAAFEGLSERANAALFVWVMAVAGVMAVAAAASAGRAIRGRALSWPMGIAAAVVAGEWGYDSGTWRHLDDAVALALTAAAVALIAKGKAPWWLIGIMLGTASAAKPWALILVPVIIGLPRIDRPKATLAMLATFGFWWLPFMLAAPNTSSALGHYLVVPHPASVLYLFGVRGPVQSWLRPTQFILGIGVGCLVATRRSWTSAPLAALAARVLTDPFSYAYYGLGPMLFAFVYDLTDGPSKRFPVVTSITVLIEFVLPPLQPGSTVIAVLKLVWGLGVIALIVLRKPTPEVDVPAPRKPAAQLSAAPVPA